MQMTLFINLPSFLELEIPPPKNKMSHLSLETT